MRGWGGPWLPCPVPAPTRGEHRRGRLLHLREALCRETPGYRPHRGPRGRTEERKASGPPKGPSKGGRGECGARGWGRRRQALTPPLPQPPASPRSPGSPTCVLAATRGSTSVSACAQPWPGRVPPRAPASSSVPSPAEKVTSLGKDWHRPCLRCERCGKTLTPGGHAEVRGARPPTARGAGGRPEGASGGLRGSRAGPAWRLWAQSGRPEEGYEGPGSGGPRRADGP